MPASDTRPLPIRTLVADDEALARGLLATFVRRDPDLQWVGEAGNGGEALAAIESLKPDLVLLDVQMPVLGGIEVLEQLPGPDQGPEVILVTAHADHAIRAFDLQVCDYLVKPVRKERFVQAIDRAKAAIRRRMMCRLTEQLMDLGRAVSAPAASEAISEPLVVNHGSERVPLRPREILWLEAANQYTRIHSDRGEFLMSESLAECQRRLSHPAFIRVHRSALINGRRARSVRRRANGGHEIELDDGARVALARSRRDLLPLIYRWVNPP